MKYELIFKDKRVKNVVLKNENVMKNYITENFDKLLSVKKLNEEKRIFKKRKLNEDEPFWTNKLIDTCWNDLKRRAREGKYISITALESTCKDFSEDNSGRINKDINNRLYNEMIEKMDQEGYELMFDAEYDKKYDVPPDHSDTLKYYYIKKAQKEAEAKKVQNEAVRVTPTDDNLNTSVKSWYISTYKDDELGERIDSDVTFVEILKNPKDVYKLLDVYDSVIRERVFLEISKRAKIDYDEIYKKMVD